MADLGSTKVFGDLHVTGEINGEVAGNAASATKLETARTIALSGDVTGSASFDGTGNVTLTATVQDDSHNHTIANVDGLQGALDSKQETLVSGTNIKTVNGLSLVGSGDVEVQSGSSIAAYAYDSRATLRTLTPVADAVCVVEGLGLFRFVVGSDEPDDDESCFATATGRWLLEAVHWDVVDAWQLPDDEARDGFDEDEPLRFDSRFDSRFDERTLHGTATCAITSLTTGNSASFTGTVAGAAVGDRVIATPPAQLGTTAADTGRLSYHAWVSTLDTVTVMLTNASAGTATVNSAVQTAWPITVIKEV